MQAKSANVLDIMTAMAADITRSARMNPLSRHAATLIAAFTLSGAPLACIADGHAEIDLHRLRAVVAQYPNHSLVVHFALLTLVGAHLREQLTLMIGERRLKRPQHLLTDLTHHAATVAAARWDDRTSRNAGADNSSNATSAAGVDTSV